MRKSIWLDALIVLFSSVLCYLQTQWYIFFKHSHFGWLTAMVVGAVLLGGSFIVLYLKTGRGIKAFFGVMLICGTSVLLNVKFENLPALLLDNRLRTYYKDEYDADVVLRGKPGYYRKAYLVYFLEDEPEYPFRAYAKFEDQNLDYEYHHAVTAMLIDEQLEKELDDLIDGTFKMSTDSLSIRLNGKPDSLEFEELVENTSFIQMYCILDEEMSENKEELIQKVYDHLRPYFENKESSIYFAFVEDPVHCEKFSQDFYQDENVYVRLDRPLESEDKKEEKSQEEISEKWEKMIDFTEDEKLYLLSIFESKPEIHHLSNLTGYPITMEFAEDRIEVFVDSEKLTPLVTIKTVQNKWEVQYYVNQRRDFKYDHQDETDRLAYLSTDYYINPFDLSIPMDILICTLDVPESTEYDTFHFIYDESEKKMMNDQFEEIIFTKDLHKKIVDYCESFLESNRAMRDCLDAAFREIMSWIEHQGKYEFEESLFDFDGEQMKCLS